MAAKLQDVKVVFVDPNAAQATAAAMAGSSGVPMRARRGSSVAAQPHSCNMMLYGDWGTGKTYLIINLLLSGERVFVLMTDFGRSGLSTVYNYFREHPDKAHLLDNLVVYSPEPTESDPNAAAKGVMDFCSKPSLVEIEFPDGHFGNIYEFAPTVLFWDGLTAYQGADLEALICGPSDYLREDTGWKDWRSVVNGTIFPLMRFLELHGKNGEAWSKIITFLDEKKPEYEKAVRYDKFDKPIRTEIEGTNKFGPMLHTGARKISGAGFDVMVRTTVKSFQDKDEFYYTVRTPEAMVKQRGFKLPTEINATKENLWASYIKPRLVGFGAPTNTTTAQKEEESK